MRCKISSLTDRQYGQTSIERYGHRILVTPANLEKAIRLVMRFGSYGAFFARFVPGLRFMAGPLGGQSGVTVPTVFHGEFIGRIDLCANLRGYRLSSRSQFK
jgi:membrane protein DedA with SNARE-associated domain